MIIAVLAVAGVAGYFVLKPRPKLDFDGFYCPTIGLVGEELTFVVIENYNPIGGLKKVDEFGQEMTTYSGWSEGITVEFDGIKKITGESSTVTFTFDEPGTYVLRARKEGFEEASWTVEIYSGLFELYNSRSGRLSLLWTYQSEDDIYHSISGNGEYIIASNGNLYLFSRQDNIPLWTYEGAWSGLISNEGKYITAGTRWDEFSLFTKKENTPVWTYKGKPVAMSSDGSYIVSVEDIGYEHTIWKVSLLHKSKNEPLWSYTIKTEIPYYTYSGLVDMSSDGEYLVIALEDTNARKGIIYLFERSDNIPLWRYYTPDASIDSVHISADGNYIVAVTWLGRFPWEEVFLFNKSDNIPLWRRGYCGSFSSRRSSSEFALPPLHSATFFFGLTTSQMIRPMIPAIRTIISQSAAFSPRAFASR